MGSPTFANGRTFYGVTLPLGPDYGGAMCFAHYSFLGIDPRGLRDAHADYFEQNACHARIQHEHSVRNPGRFRGYGADCWGLTASDDDRGYHQHAPDNDIGAHLRRRPALSSFPYLPNAAMQALGVFMGRRKHGLDALRPARRLLRGARLVRSSTLAIDQGPIVGMIENHRSGLLWELGMSCRARNPGGPCPAWLHLARRSRQRRDDGRGSRPALVAGRGLLRDLCPLVPGQRRRRRWRSPGICADICTSGPGDRRRLADAFLSLRSGRFRG